VNIWLPPSQTPQAWWVGIIRHQAGCRCSPLILCGLGVRKSEFTWGGSEMAILMTLHIWRARRRIDSVINAHYYKTIDPHTFPLKIINTNNLISIFGRLLLFMHFIHPAFSYNLVGERRLRLFGHIARQCADSDSKLVMRAPMHKPLLGWKRQRGRPCSKWLRAAVEDDLKTANIGLHFPWKKAQNRDAWKCVVRHGYASGHALWWWWWFLTYNGLI